MHWHSLKMELLFGPTSTFTTSLGRAGRWSHVFRPPATHNEPPSARKGSSQTWRTYYLISGGIVGPRHPAVGRLRRCQAREYFRAGRPHNGRHRPQSDSRLRWAPIGANFSRKPIDGGESGDLCASKSEAAK